jgi:hypothetical protein
MTTHTSTFAALSILALVAAGCGGLGTAQRDLRSAVEAQRPTLASCYGAALERDRNAAGTVEARLLVTKETGQVEQVTIDRSDVADQGFQSCFTDALRSIRIDPKPGVNLDIAYTFELTPSG